MAQKKASLACAECGSRNYSINVSSTPKPTRLEVNKFCKHCKKYTLHKETRLTFSKENTKRVGMPALFCYNKCR